MGSMASPTAVNRLTKDYQKLLKEPIDGISVAPLPENILIWHYVILGSPDTPYHGGIYHGRLVFQPDFPWKPPAIYMDTPSGRFIVGMRLCLSISDYHPESWNPGWSVGSILLGVQSFMNEDSLSTGVVSPATTRTEKERMALASLDYNKRDKMFCELFPTFLEELSEDGSPLKRTMPGPSSSAHPSASVPSSANPSAVSLASNVRPLPSSSDECEFLEVVPAKRARLSHPSPNGSLPNGQRPSSAVSHHNHVVYPNNAVEVVDLTDD